MVHPERNRGHHRRADNGAVDEVVKGVAEQDQRRRNAMNLALVGVAVAQEDQLLQYEENEDAEQKRPEHRPGPQSFERLG